MKLYYIFLGGSTKGSSVQHKIMCQIRELRAQGIDAQGLFFSQAAENETLLNEHIRLIPLVKPESSRRYFQSFYETQEYYRQMAKFLKSHVEHDAYIFLRHGSSGPEYFKLLRHFAKRLFLYIPSNTIGENYRERQHAVSSGAVGYGFRWYEYYRYFYLHERRLIRNYLPKLAGVVVFTEEFGRMLNRMAEGKIKIIYNRDGADCAGIRVRTPKYQGEKIRLLFMKGSSMLQPWSGLDRLIRSIEKDPESNVELYITGNVVEASRYDKPFIRLTGRLSDADLEALVDEVDLGVSNLANYLIGFSETTNLKSRDYFARGLPFIQANSMPDVEGTVGADYYLRLPNEAAHIDMSLVRDFALKMRRDAEHPKKMREFAEKVLDWRVTVKELAVALEGALKPR